MFRDVSLIFLGYRVLTFAFFLALSLGKPITEQALLVVPSVLYLLLSIYLFLYPGRLRLFKNYGDLLFIPALVLLSGQKEAIFSLMAPMALYTSRRVFNGMLFLWLSVGFGFYYYGKIGLVLLPLFTAIFLASLHPDLVEALRKERFYVRSLRKSYSKLASEYARLEKEMENLKTVSALLSILHQSQTLEDYLRALKEEFNLKSISITPLTEGSYEKVVLDRTNCTLQMPIKLERGNALITFYLNNPLELYDEKLTKNLERAGKLINLYLEGFEVKAQVKTIAV
ncbi:MAG: hypothetical protein RMK75_01690 [Aquificaceae bacterium]|nr:hypothetical protein [Aquificaceae bacterium]MDW8423023.1 hypothetical protein [Aquificaceae bacterium]